MTGSSRVSFLFTIDNVHIRVNIFTSNKRWRMNSDYILTGISKADMMHKQLYALPDMTVGHYKSQKDPDYYRKHLIPVDKKAQIPAGIYACGIHIYRCPKCGHRRTMLTLFLPVRDQKKVEELLFFDNGDLDSFIYQQNNAE